MPRPAFVLPAELYQRAAYGSRLPEAVGQGISSYIQERKEKERLELQERILNENRRLKQLELQLGISKEMMVPQTAPLPGMLPQAGVRGGYGRLPQAGMERFAARAPLPTIGAGLPPQRLTEGLRLPMAPRQATFEEAGLMMGETIPEYLRGAYAYRAPEKVNIAGLAGLARLGIAEKELGLKYPKKRKEIYEETRNIAKAMGLASVGGYYDTKRKKYVPILDRQTLMSTLRLMGINPQAAGPEYAKLREMISAYPKQGVKDLPGVGTIDIPTIRREQIYPWQWGGMSAEQHAISKMQEYLRKQPAMQKYIDIYGQSSIPTDVNIQPATDTGRIRVIDRETGQTGTIPEDEYDAKIYELMGQ